MNANQNHRNLSIFNAVARYLGGSRLGQLFFSVAIAAVFFGLAYVVWLAPDLAATVLTVSLLVYGYKLAWHALPLSSATRAFLDCDPQIAEGCPACDYRGFLWGGISIGILNYWASDSTKPFGFPSLILPAVFMVISVISSIVCCRFTRHERNTGPRATAARSDAQGKEDSARVL